MFFTNLPKKSFTELQGLLESLLEDLDALATVPIPTVFPLADDVWYTYTAIFGENPFQHISKLVTDFLDLKHCVESQETYLEKIKTPAKIEEFKGHLKSHIANPQYYPNIPDFIKERENTS